MNSQSQSFLHALLSQQIIRFGLIGTTAALIHFLTVIILVAFIKLNPLHANVIGFLCAFGCSYIGHHTWTFESNNQNSSAALSKFFIIAVSAMALNQFLFYMLLRFTSLPYTISLFMVLVAVAAITFVTSKYWAFKTQHHE